MLQENKSYIMKIIFDEEEFILPLVTGSNPKYTFEQIITKQFKYDDLEKKYMEIIFYSLPKNIDIYKIGGSREELIQQADIYSSFKISLLTIVIGPEFHNLALTSPYKKNVHLGRVMYTITSKQIANINIKINSVKLTLNNLSNNDVALKLKYHDKKLTHNSTYTNSLKPNVFEKEKIVEYIFNPKKEESNPLNLNIKTSMYDLALADSSLNVYTSIIINDEEDISLKDSIFRKYNSNVSLNNLTKENSQKLINHYTMIGFSILSFLDILSENDEALNKQSSQFFRHVSGFNMPTEDNSGDSDKNNNLQVFTFQIFQDVNKLIETPLYYEGLEVGKCEINIIIKKIPLIRQIMCGVMTENGFEINSIHLYDNLISAEGSTLSNEITELITNKRNFNNELIKQKQIQSKANHEYNLTILGYLKDFKKILSKTIEVDRLYYGYTVNQDLYTGQNVILDLGLILIKIIDKLNKDQRNLIFEILKLINNRSEFALGTLSTKWFKEKNEKKFGGISDNIYVFMDNSLLRNKIIENFLEFNYNCLKYSLDIINRGKLVDPQSLDFAENYIKLAYFRIPIFREVLLNSISLNVTEKIVDMLNQGNLLRKAVRSKTIVNDFIESDPINSLLLWEGLFYDRLNSALEENSKNEKIENEIKEKIIKFKILLDINNKTNEINNTPIAINKEESKNEWKKIFSQRDTLFFNFTINVITYIQSKDEASNDVNWLNIVGIDTLLNAIIHEIHQRPVQFKKIFKLFLNNSDITNTLIKEVVIKTNLYDIPGIFNLLDIINSLFEEFEIYNKGTSFLKFNYVLMNQIDKCIFKVDHSMCVSKLILLYYNCAHLMSTFHIGEIMQNIFFSKFYNLFFHWSYEVRDKFYYFILFIIGYRLGNVVPFGDLEDLKYIKKSSYNDISGKSMHKSLGNILENKLKIIKELLNIILVQNYDMNFNNIINPIKYAHILKQIPNDVHKNIVIALHHYKKIYEEYKIFIEFNRNKDKKDIQYPELELILPRDE